MSRKRVIRLMQEAKLKARLRKRFKGTTMSDHDLPVAANLLDRQFTADRACLTGIPFVLRSGIPWQMLPRTAYGGMLTGPNRPTAPSAEASDI